MCYKLLWRSFCDLKKLKSLCPEDILSYVEESVLQRMFYGKELQKTIQKEFRIKKVIKGKVDKLYIKWKGYDNPFNSWIDKKTDIVWMTKYFPKSKSLAGNVKVELDWYNYAAKAELKTAGADTSDFYKMILILINWKMYQVI